MKLLTFARYVKFSKFFRFSRKFVENFWDYVFRKSDSPCFAQTALTFLNPWFFDFWVEYIEHCVSKLFQKSLCIIFFFSRKMSRKIFIGNLPDRADGRDVEDFFRGCGRIVEISLKDGYGNLHNVKPFVNLDF